MKQVSTIACGGREGGGERQRNFQVRSTANPLDESNSCESISYDQSEWDTYNQPPGMSTIPCLYTNPNGIDYG